METNDERRRRKLAALCEQFGGVREVAERSGHAWATLDQILKGTLLPAKGDGTRSPRALGDASARAIEQAFDLGRGWFDWPFEAVDFKSYAALSDLERGYVQARMVSAIEECEEKRPKPVMHGIRGGNHPSEKPSEKPPNLFTKPVAKKAKKKKSA